MLKIQDFNCQFTHFLLYFFTNHWHMVEIIQSPIVRYCLNQSAFDAALERQSASSSSDLLRWRCMFSQSEWKTSSQRSSAECVIANWVRLALSRVLFIFWGGRLYFKIWGAFFAVKNHKFPYAYYSLTLWQSVRNKRKLELYETKNFSE